jgi:hypothetical protein
MTTAATTSVEETAQTFNGPAVVEAKPHANLEPLREPIQQLLVLRILAQHACCVGVLNVHHDFHERVQRIVRQLCFKNPLRLRLGFRQAVSQMLLHIRIINGPY